MKRLGEYHRGLTLEAKKVRFCSHALAEETNSSLPVNQVPSLNEGPPLKKKCPYSFVCKSDSVASLDFRKCESDVITHKCKQIKSQMHNPHHLSLLKLAIQKVRSSETVKVYGLVIQLFYKIR
ncbi:hypothetical protein WN944_012855 [Citrus x changshan-huyou]|uniref:Uncharacterized protein n=1 Tax=Citrus x changshan-huyou TaxID=2935761 RepID=A0AAP0M410_9ROSI